MQNDKQDIFDEVKPLDEAVEEQEIIDLAGYQVTKAELFAHTREPAITVWEDRIKFNMACLRRFPNVTHIQLLIHPEQRRLIIRPCDPDAPDSLRWANGGGEKERRNRDMRCHIFAAKLFDLMLWDKQYRYKMLGKPAVYGSEVLFLFNLSDFELFVTTGLKKKAFLFAGGLAGLFWDSRGTTQGNLQNRPCRRLCDHRQCIGGTMI